MSYGKTATPETPASPMPTEAPKTREMKQVGPKPSKGPKMGASKSLTHIGSLKHNL